MQFFRHLHTLHEGPHADRFLSLCRPDVFERTDGTSQNYHAYPLQNLDGSLDYDCVRIHENRRKFYFREPASGAWVTKNIMGGAYSWNGIASDDQWIWSLLHMALAPEIFVTHVPKFGNYRIDLLRCAEVMCIAGPKGENGWKPGRKTVNGSTVQSFSLGDMMRENTRFANDLRGLREGITLADGSYPDLSQAHGAEVDAFWTEAFLRYAEREMPDLLAEMEANADWKDIYARLTGTPGAFGDNPIHAYVDKTAEGLSGSMVTLIDTDHHRHNSKRALLYNLDIDPETFCYQNAGLHELSPRQYAEIMRSGRRYDNSIFKEVPLHKMPRILSMATGFAAGFNHGLDERSLQARKKKAPCHDPKGCGDGGLPSRQSVAGRAGTAAAGAVGGKDLQFFLRAGTVRHAKRRQYSTPDAPYHGGKNRRRFAQAYFRSASALVAGHRSGRQHHPE